MEPLRLAAGVMVATQTSKVRPKEIASVDVGEQVLHIAVVHLLVMLSTVAVAGQAVLPPRLEGVLYLAQVEAEAVELALLE